MPVYVGGAVANKVGATSGNSTIALNSGLTGGIASSAQSGDLVIAGYATGAAADRTLSITDGTTEYTLIGSELYANGTTYDSNLRVGYKFITNDTAVTFGPTGNIQDAGAMFVHVWRNVNTGTPLDGVTPTTATGTATGRPNPPTITPSTAGAIVIAVGGGAAITGANFTQSGSELSNFRSTTGNDTNDGTIGVGSFAWSSGAFDPVVWTGGTTGAADSWTAMCFVLRPGAAPASSLTATLSFAGVDTTRISKALAAVLNFVGALVGQQPGTVYEQGLSAALGFAGGAVERAGKALSAALAFSTGSPGGTFGDDTDGGDDFPTTANRALLSKFNATVTGTVTGLTIYWDSTGSGVGNMKGLIYAADGAGGIPGTLLGTGSAVATSNGAGSSVSPGLSVPVTQGVDYWLGYVSDGTNNPRSRGDSSGGASRSEGTEGMSYATPPATWIESGTTAFRLNVVATVAGAPGGLYKRAGKALAAALSFAGAAVKRKAVALSAWLHFSGPRK